MIRPRWTGTGILLNGALVLLILVVLLRILPEGWRQALAGATTVGVMAATGGLVWVTWLYVQRADKQRRTAMMPVVVLENTYADHWARNSAELRKAWLRLQKFRESHPTITARSLPSCGFWSWGYRRKVQKPGRALTTPDDLQAEQEAYQGFRVALVNSGTGVALNVHAWYRDGSGPTGMWHVATLGVGASYELWLWAQVFRDHLPEEVWVRYEDIEGNHYNSHCCYSGDDHWQGKWIVAEGDGEAPVGGDPYWG